MRKWQNFVNKDQLQWVKDQLDGFDTVVVTLHGSMLYGLEREGSDVDVKAIYLPSFKDLLLGNSIKTHNRKNEDLDIEIEIKSLPSFLNSAKSCDTNCVDMLWTPEDMTIIHTTLWEDIKFHRKDLLSKSMKGLLGYIKTHTHKYSNKIQRYQEMKILLDEINFIEDTIKLSGTTLPEIIARNSFKYIKYVTKVSDHEQTYIEVCGKKYILSWECKLLKEAVSNELKRYGERTKDGDSKGLDAKSLSHALRVLCELKELVTTGGITFPLKDAEHVKQVKLGEIKHESDVIYIIDNLYEECISLIENSNLPEDSDISGMLNVLEKSYNK
jgi:hypothetical protein